MDTFQRIEDIYKENYWYLKKILITLTKDEFISEDIIQEVFSKLLKNPEQIKEINYLKSWLGKSAKNAYIDYYRKKSPTLLEDDEIISNLLISNADPESITQVNASLVNIFEKLHHLDKTILIAKEYYGFKYEEISTFVSLSPNAVKTRLFRVRKRIIKSEKGEFL
ncbi:RNA polymerase sigma-70 factor, ECF subfamily [Gracilibacillus orientalis]|uniref:RNA polymerase sigma-70 factor, ECF subfamily n=1 Tax=Gracilibacillus orientalis TaxID=334253 RepID=A0A1I4K2G0_9BACI|nr:RNA polymerase sigma factor [Gracilibacillus orientalis]SFL72626.1 RNA polymerase sigma-70 factor, ECF subfamily [Gracilibacillus orientalis]